MAAEPASGKDWTKIFKGLGNENRLKIIKFLYPTKSLTVTELKEKLGISFKWTSQNLVDLEKISILESEGFRGHVVYRIHRNLPKKLIKIIETFI
ncbi:MAG: winged helix-turn-helix domain-containing protein [Patescibacteria group bacterium]